MVKVQVLVFWHKSQAEQVTVLVVLGRKAVPDGGEEETPARAQLSEALTVQATIALVPQVVTTMLLGQAMVGGVVSTMVTVRLQTLEPPQHSSTACQSCVMVPLQ